MQREPFLGPNGRSFFLQAAIGLAIFWTLKTLFEHDLDALLRPIVRAILT